MLLSFLPVRRGDREKCESGGVVIQSDGVKKVVRTSRSSFRGVRFVVEGESECLGNETLHRNCPSSTIHQATPPVAETRTIELGGSRLKFVGSPPTPSFTTNTKVVGGSIPQLPVTIFTLIGLVRIPARF